MQIKRILFWVKCGHKREKVKGKKWRWLAILIPFGQEKIGNSCKGYRSLLPSPDFSKMGFMGTCSRAISTLIPPVSAFLGSDAPFVLAELGKRLQGIKGIQGCFSPALSCSLVKSFCSTALAEILWLQCLEVGWACTGMKPELSTGAQKTQPRLPVSKEMAKGQPQQQRNIPQNI